MVASVHYRDWFVLLLRVAPSTVEMLTDGLGWESESSRADAARAAALVRRWRERRNQEHPSESALEDARC